MADDVKTLQIKVKASFNDLNKDMQEMQKLLNAHFKALKDNKIDMTPDMKTSIKSIKDVFQNMKKEYVDTGRDIVNITKDINTALAKDLSKGGAEAGKKLGDSLK